MMTTMMMIVLMMIMIMVLVSGFGNKKATSTKSNLVRSNEAIAIYRKLRDPTKVKSGGMFDKTNSQLDSSYKSLVSVLKSEDDAIKAVQAYPDVLLTDGQRVSDNFKVYESKWAFEKAKTVVINNPSLLQVQTTGYGSAEAAGDETVYVSYLVALTRPAGPVLLSLLLLALGKAVIFGIN